MSIARKFVIGDIRGDLGLLLKLLDKIAPSERDVLIFLGSYLGPARDSKGVVQYLLDLQKKPGTFLFLRGCYEWLFPRCIESKPPWELQKLWQEMGGMNVLRSYASEENLVYLSRGTDSSGNGKAKVMSVEVPIQIPEPHIRFLEGQLHQWFEDDILPFIACHSGAHPLIFGEEMPQELSAFTVKDWWKNDSLQIPGKEIIFSHFPFKKPFEGKGKVGIDLGAGFGGKLCAMEMYTREFTVAYRD